jgi:hypothetical protein
MTSSSLGVLAVGGIGAGVANAATTVPAPAPAPATSMTDTATPGDTPGTVDSGNTQ